MGEKIHHPLFDLSGRVAMVTGGGIGLGREFCEILAEFGADIICLDLHIGRANETCEIIRRKGFKASPIEADVSKYEQVQEVFKNIRKIYGRLDILVNNAGITRPSVSIHEMDIKDWHKVIDVNLNGVFYCMKEALSIMLEQKKGSIINISSICGLYAVRPDILSTAHYTASKSGVIGLTKQGAAEYGRFGIRVNCIAPGWHGGTMLLENAGVKRTEEEKKIFDQKIIAETPLGRKGYPHELKGLVLYLAADCSSFVTGQVIIHDGGWTCW